MEPIRFYNRYTQKIETEAVYGERWIRLMYENPIGSFFLWALVSRAIFSRYYGWRMRARNSGWRVIPFIDKYGLDVQEFEKNYLEYQSFNEFFCRKLKKTARPIAEGDDVVIFPADARHLAFENIDQAEGFYVKGSKFALAELLGDADLAKAYQGGSMVISRLCPVDYHRFHFPCAGTPSETRLIPGPLFSVNPIALRRRIEYLAQNKRVVTELEGTVCGKVILVEVGATNVGTIKQTYVPGRPVAKGEEKGLFAFGGSCTITLFPPGRVRFDDDILTYSRQFIETYAKMGDRLGVARRA